MPIVQQPARRSRAVSAVIAIFLVAAAIVPQAMAPAAAGAAIGHLVVSEVVTGGAGASDEFIELYNPSSEALPLEGLELVYASASGLTVTRRTAWGLGADSVAPGAHLLVANELGIYAPGADALYAGGMAATGGSVALRIQGAATAIDAVGWGTAASVWLEGSPAPAPAAGASLERRPGGDAGSTVDTNDNLADFVVRADPDPQNLSSPQVPAATSSPSPSASTPMPTPTLTPTPTSAPSATAEPTPSATDTPPTILAIGVARGLPIGSSATIQGTALTASDFADGGGYVADGSGGIAVLLEGGSFARGDVVTVTGTIDDRFAQRTLRAETASTAPGGVEGAAAERATGTIDESAEGQLVRVTATIDGGSTELTGGVAFDVDDGSGVARVIVGSATGIDTSDWSDGRIVVVTGVVGQRDSSGTGLAGYRVQPRDASDVELLPAPSPTPSPSPSVPGGPTPSPTPSPAAVITIAEARSAPKNAGVSVRGVVTLPSGTIEPGSAVIQDATGAILLRLGDDPGELGLGELVEVDGVRSTKSGMESVRVTGAPRRLGSAPPPAPRQLRSGEAGELHEAQLVVVRGSLVASARRASSGSVSFEIDDGSGPLRIVLGRGLAADDDALGRGTRVEVIGPLGQDTTGAQPLRGYRIWPARPGDVRVLAAATTSGDDDDDDDPGRDDDDRGPSTGGGSAGSASLGGIGAGPLGELRVGATLVATGWDEAGLAGLLWDGRVLVGIAAASGETLDAAIGTRRVPFRVELGHLGTAGVDQRFGISVVTLGAGAGDVLLVDSPATAPAAKLPGRQAPAAWVSVVGRLSRDQLRVGGQRVQVESLCAAGSPTLSGSVSVTGVALARPARIVVPCGGLRPASSLTLARATTPVVPELPAPEPAAARLLADTSPAEAGRRGVAAGLLGTGIAVLLLASLGGRIIGSRSAADAHAVPATDGDPAGGGARLTLVSVPREHG